MRPETPKVPHQDQRTVLDAFSRALNLEAHVLKDHPHLLWQQLYNRLQWEGEAVSKALESEYARRTAPGARPWIKNHTLTRESKTLVRTLAGHTSDLRGLAFSPDGSTLAFCGVRGSNLHLVPLTGLEYGPIILTAEDRGAGLELKCPACGGAAPLERGWLGAEVRCPNPDCDLAWRVNPFVVGKPQKKAWQFWKR